MDSEKNNECKITVRISAENGKQIIKDDQVDVLTFHDEQNGSEINSQATTSYLSNLSSAIRSLRHETNSVLTQFISDKSSKNNGAGDAKEVDPDGHEEDISDDDDTESSLQEPGPQQKKIKTTA